MRASDVQTKIFEPWLTEVKGMSDWCSFNTDVLIGKHSLFWKFIDRISSTTSCARLGLIQFKVLHRLHYSKAKLAIIYPTVDNRCDRCSHAPANLSHLFFLCPNLQPFWGIFLKTLSDILKISCVQILWPPYLEFLNLLPIYTPSI